MSKRISTGKKMRFEVFKRDKFTCQYCGKQAPNVILEVDHIDPVSKSGTNDILNLITSCTDCNRGKSNIQLDDDSVLSKQRQQLELLQERREQIELIFKWRKELDKLDDDTSDMVVSYVHNKISGYTLNHTGARSISTLAKKFGVADLLEAIDISASKYLKHGNEGVLTSESVEEFINKIGGILAIKNRPPIEQKLSYIKGICRNRFNYWNDQSGAILLNDYVKALKDYGWNDERILDDLETELIPKTKEAKNWSSWRDLIEKWTNDIRGWSKQEETEEAFELTEEEIEECAISLHKKVHDVLPALVHIGMSFDNFDESRLEQTIKLATEKYISNLLEYYSSPEKQNIRKPSFRSALHSVHFTELYMPINDMLTYYLDLAVDGILEHYISDIEIYNDENAKSEDFVKLLAHYKSANRQYEKT